MVAIRNPRGLGSRPKPIRDADTGLIIARRAGRRAYHDSQGATQALKDVVALYRASLSHD